MKHGKNPTRRQKQSIASVRLNPENRLVCKDTPDELVLSAWFQSGQIFRCGCVWRRGYGKVFYFQPGHETYPTYNENEYVRTVIRNAVRYVARPAGLNPRLDCPHVGELERVPDCDRIDH